LSQQTFLTKQAEFTFYTGAAGWSTMFPDDNEVQEAVASYVMDALPSGRGLEKNPLTWVGQKLAASNNTVANSIIQVRNTFYITSACLSTCTFCVFTQSMY
jgi:hypothetical protein